MAVLKRDPAPINHPIAHQGSLITTTPWALWFNKLLAVVEFAPADPDRSVQFNDAGAFGGDSRFQFLPTGQVAIGGTLSQSAQPFIVTAGDRATTTFGVVGINLVTDIYQELMFGAEYTAGGYLARSVSPAEVYVDGDGFGIFATFHETPGAAWTQAVYTNLFVYEGGASLQTDAGFGLFEVANVVAHAIAAPPAQTYAVTIDENGLLGSTASPPGSGITQLTGDVTAGPGSGSQAATIAAHAVTFAKMQTIATQTIIGRDTAGTGDPESISISAALDWLTT